MPMSVYGQTFAGVNTGAWSIGAEEIGESSTKECINNFINIHMNKFFKIAPIFIWSLFVAIPGSFSQNDASTRRTTIYKFDIKEEIAPPVWRKTKNALKEAKELKADYVLIHMNTYGGLLDAADSIRTAILQFPIPTMVFIDNNAASAGALISIACDSIYMRKGANIGAATVVNQTGEAVPDKYQSYMRSLMRSTAEANGRNPDIAQAMVDPRIEITQVVDSGSVLTFTVSEAIKNGFCEGQAETIYEVIDQAGINDYKIIEQELTALDGIIGFLIKPYISGILIMLIIGGIYFELQSPGLGFPSAIAVLGAMLYFAPLYLEGLAANWEILLFFIGLVLIVVEIFAIPGFGVAGISGIILIITGLTLSMVDKLQFTGEFNNVDHLIRALSTVLISIFIAIIASLKITQTALTTTIFGQLALASTQQASEGFRASEPKYAVMIGKSGTAKTNLRPAGKIIIEDDIFDATALSGYIEKGTKIKVIKYETSQLFVLKDE